MMSAQDIIDLCEANWDAHKFDCSGFVKAVAAALQISTFAPDDDANVIVDKLHATTSWNALTPGDGVAAKAQADAGSFVIAGLKGADQISPDPRGHVVVVVTGPLDSTHHEYPTAYWGSLGGRESPNPKLCLAGRRRDKVAYFVNSMGAICSTIR